MALKSMINADIGAMQWVEKVMNTLGYPNIYIGYLCGRQFPLKRKGAVQKSYVRPAILYGSEVRYL